MLGRDSFGFESGPRLMSEWQHCRSSGRGFEWNSLKAAEETEEE